MRKTLATLAAIALLVVGCGDGGDGSASEEETPEQSAYPAEQTSELQAAATVAYQGAAAYALTNDNYFARNSTEAGELAAAVSTALSEEDTGGASTYADQDELGKCSPYGDTLMIRIWSSEDGRDLVLAAADDSVVVELSYGAGDAEPTVGEPQDCQPV